MGICCSATRYEQSSEYLKARIADCIESNSYNKLPYLRKCLKLVQKSRPTDYFTIDDPIIAFKDIELNALGYAIWCGSKECFEILYEKYGATIQKMNTLFARAGKSPLSIICEKGYVSLLGYFLPLYLKSQRKEATPSASVCSEELSIFMEKTRSSRNLDRKLALTTYTPVQLAVEKGQLSVLRYLVEYFKSDKVPREFDVNSVDELLGENSALIAVRTANLKTIEYLHRYTTANFHVVNKRNEDAVLIAAAWSKKKPQKNYLEVIKYLVETVKLDISGSYAEILLVLDDVNIIRYIETKLSELGINATKRDIEHENKIVVPEREKSSFEKKIEQIGTSEIRVLMKETEGMEDEDKYSEISSIAPVHSRSITPIFSVLYHLDTKEEF